MLISKIYLCQQNIGQGNLCPQGKGLVWTSTKPSDVRDFSHPTNGIASQVEQHSFPQGRSATEGKLEKQNKTKNCRSKHESMSPLKICYHLNESIF